MASVLINVTNGDVASWPDLWPAIAGALGMEMRAPEALSLAQGMPRQAEQRRAIVRKYALSAPAELHAFVGESFYFADAYFTSVTARPVLVSTIKLRQAGFADCMDSEDMMRKWLGRCQELRLLPPVA